MVQLNLVKNEHLSRLRVSGHRRTDLPRRELIPFSPLKIDRGFATVVLNALFVRRMKELLPTYVQPANKVAHIHQLLLSHARNYCRINGLIRLAAIEQWCCSLLLCYLDTREENLHGKAMSV